MGSPPKPSTESRQANGSERDDVSVGDDDRLSIGDFLGEPTRRLSDWKWLWTTDASFPIRSHRGWAGKVLVAFKRLLRPLVSVPQNDLWERQRVFNLIVLEYLQRISELHSRIDGLEGRLEAIEGTLREGLDEVMRYVDALYSRVDQKVDSYRRQASQQTSSLQAALACVEEVERPAEALAETVAELRYREFEDRYRGTTEEIRRRAQRYLPLFAGRSPVLDLGCGRGEALQVLEAEGLEARGVDKSAEMVELCRSQGLAAERGDLLDALRESEPGSLGAIVSLHVIEHLASNTLQRMIDLAWQALEPGGVMVLETPNPRSLIVGASNFWLDPTHVRPVHPETLCHLCRSSGFEEVEIWDASPFPKEARLPEIAIDELPAETRLLGDRVNRLRDRLDDLLYGEQDYAVIATKGRGQALG